MKDKHFASRMLTCAGALMSISGILMAICAKLAYGGILFAAAACMFFAARNFRIAEDKKEDKNQEAETELEKESAISAGKTKEEKQIDNYGTEGMCMGMCLGTAIGIAFGNNIGIGISLGMLIGLAIGTCIKK